MFGLTLTAWNANGVRLVAARQAGVLKRWRATPLPRWCYLTGRITATVLVAVLAGAVTVAVAALLYHLHLTLSSTIAVLAVFVLGAAAWAAAATALTAAIPTVEAATPILTLIYFPLIIISGVLGSISEPHWLSTLASYLPAQPLIAGATHALQHPHGTALLPTRDIVVLAAWAVAGIAIAVPSFRWEPQRATQRRASPDHRTTPAQQNRRIHGWLTGCRVAAMRRQRAFSPSWPTPSHPSIGGTGADSRADRALVLYLFWLIRSFTSRRASYKR